MRKGFTLIELLVIIAIVATLGAGFVALKSSDSESFPSKSKEKDSEEITVIEFRNDGVKCYLWDKYWGTGEDNQMSCVKVEE